MNTRPPRELFWLHVRKSAGTSVRDLLGPSYRSVDRTAWPACFVQSAREDYNDILNNYRVPLGRFQNRRCRFARDHLYREDWPKLFSFAFAREPLDRCVSMFMHTYRFHEKRWSERRLFVSYVRRRPRIARPMSFRFDAFLHRVEQCQEERSLYWPLDLHFSTHTAALAPDICDEDGAVLLTRLYRLESLVPALREVFAECAIESSLPEDAVRKNSRKRPENFVPDAAQQARVRRLYARDFELFEDAVTLHG